MSVREQRVVLRESLQQEKETMQGKPRMKQGLITNLPPVVLGIMVLCHVNAYLKIIIIAKNI